MNVTLGAVIATVALLIGCAAPVLATCDAIPGPMQFFRGTRGSVNRPFASPGDFVSVRLSPTCDNAVSGFADDGDQYVVTIIFMPPAGPINAVALAKDCAPVDAALQSCGQPPGGCMAVNHPAESVKAIQTFTAAPPFSDRQLRFRFPDTDALVDTATDHRTLTGPIRIAVMRAGTSISCSVLSQACAAQSPTSALIGCVDELFALDGSCGEAPHPTFNHLTALPPANSFQALCLPSTPPCTGSASEVRFTTDRAGNILLPMDWAGVLIGSDAPVARLLHGSSIVEAFPGQGNPLRIPGDSFLQSFSAQGSRLATVFDPQGDTLSADELSLFGKADSPRSVLRLARRSASFRECEGGTNDSLPCEKPADCPSGACAAAKCTSGSKAGKACDADADCPGAECGPALFDFQTRYEDAVGPVIVRRQEGLRVCQEPIDDTVPCTSDADCPNSVCVAYRITAQGPVSLDGLTASEKIFSYVVPELVNSADLNGDGDTTDDVITLQDRRTGEVSSIGQFGSSVGNAVTRVHQLPFTYPAVAVHDDIAVYLEPEPLQGYRDENGDGDILDTILRVYRVNGDELTSGMNLSIDAAPVIDGRPVALSNGLVFFRTPEWANARQIFRRISESSNGNEGNLASSSPALSYDGRIVAFVSAATNLGAGPTGSSHADLFVKDIDSNQIELVSRSTGGNPGNGDAGHPSLSADGRYIAFHSAAGNLISGDANSAPDVFVHDRLLGATEPVSVTSSGAQGAGGCELPTISADGRFVAFNCEDLFGGYNPSPFVRDRLLGLTESISIDLPGNVATQFLWPGTARPIASSLSSDGRFVAFSAENDGGYAEVAIRQRGAPANERVSAPLVAMSTDGNSWLSSVSADGRYVAFVSNAPAVVPAPGGSASILVRDRLTGITERISAPLSGARADADASQASAPAISQDGRYVAFIFDGTELVPGADSGGLPPLYIHDRITGLKERVADALLLSAWGPREVALSGDGRSVAFVTPDIPGLTSENSFTDVALRGPDPGDVSEQDRTDDGDIADTVLQVLDTGADPVREEPIGPARAASVAAGRAAFLMPEAELNPPSSPTGTDLNGDFDTTGTVVHLWSQQTGLRNLRCAATAVALSDRWIAALVTESGQSGADLNGDGDSTDTVVKLRSLAAPALASCADWTNLGVAADVLAVSDSIVAFTVPEAAQNTDLDGDGDLNDRIMQLYDASAGVLISTGRAAQEFVVSGNLLAFRVSEAAQGGTDLNGDGDTLDFVLHVYDVRTYKLLNTGQAATPCRREACDSRFPYRIVGGIVNFLTFEQEQGADLNGDGDSVDLVLQAYNPRAAAGSAQGGALAHTAGSPEGSSDRKVIGAVEAGICSQTATACTVDGDCAGGTCFMRPAGCIAETAVGCDPRITPATCAAGQFCQPILGNVGTGICHSVSGGCGADDDCSAPAVCSLGAINFQNLAGSLGTTEEGNGDYFSSDAGRCIEDVGTACPCKSGEFCESGACRFDHGVCRSSADCPGGVACRSRAVIASAGDSDGDGLSDPFDNCPTVANPGQEDRNGDDVGDVCAARRVAGPTLIIRDDDLRLRRRLIKFVVKGDIPGIVPGGVEDPTCGASGGGGGSLHVAGSSGQSVIIDLPCQNWQRTDDSPVASGYIYKDRGQYDGPCKRVQVKKGGRITAWCSGGNSMHPLRYDLTAAGEQTVAVLMRIGASKMYCARWPGNTGRVSMNNHRAYVAHAASAPVACLSFP